ncbi:hypothetical protein [Pseudomonas sp. C9-3]|uniref:hypothetical protein n=1 Tax=Pseudomonas sp. C9-3 TaxID=3078264 RepID=UPI0028F021AE|nr:hypothetical protein [Pseudomonas sp. C9-3]
MNRSNDYRTTLQQAARAYLLIHADQYLADTDPLKQACIDHLVDDLGALRALAKLLTDRAWTDAFLPRAVVWLGVDWASNVHPDNRIRLLKHT